MRKARKNTNQRKSILKSDPLKSEPVRHSERSFPRYGFFNQWIGFIRGLRRYWHAYGGAKSFLTSPYMHISLYLTAACVPFWTGEGRATDIALSTVPNLLGFTVGAMAIVIAFSDARLFKVITDGSQSSFFIKLTASLTHFLIIQVSALIIAIISKITESKPLEAICLFFLFYAVLSTLAAGFQLFQSARISNAVAGK